MFAKKGDKRLRIIQQAAARQVQAAEAAWYGQMVIMLEGESALMSTLADELEAGRLDTGHALHKPMVAMLRSISRMYAEVAAAGTPGTTAETITTAIAAMVQASKDAGGVHNSLEELESAFGADEAPTMN